MFPWLGKAAVGRATTLEESFELGAVHVDVLDELDVVDIHIVF